jgi:ACS family hexuronate transporter-like MFS transporter
VASASHALAAGLFGFVAARALLGFGEGATFPGGLRTAAQTLPADQRSRGIALAYSGGSLGAILTPVVVTPVAIAFGWRAAFLCTGLLGAAWLILWLALGGRVEALRAKSAPAPSLDSSPAPRLNDRRLWSFMAVYALGAFPLAFVLYAAPIYLHAALGCSQETLGRWLWLPPLGWEIGYFFWGWRIDRGVRPARLFPVLTLLGAPLALTPWLGRLDLVMAALFFAMFIAAGFIIGGIAHATRAFSTRHAALIAGVGAGSWSAVVAAAMPAVGWLFDRRLYSRGFVAAALFPLLGLVLWSAMERPSWYAARKT